MESYKLLFEYCNSIGVDLTISEAALHKVNLVKLCHEQKFLIKRELHPDGYFVNSYPVEILDEYFTV